jgi:hypothetical protein
MTPRGPNCSRKVLPLAQDHVAGVVLVLRLFLGVEVVEVAEEDVEAVIGRQVLVAITEVVLAELPVAYPWSLSRPAMVGSSTCMPSFAPGSPTLERPVRKTLCPMMKLARPAVQDCSP